jgi:hypothetical protein
MISSPGLYLLLPMIRRTENANFFYTRLLKPFEISQDGKGMKMKKNKSSVVPLKTRLKSRYNTLYQVV